jgi:hypothetical protein
MTYKSDHVAWAAEAVAVFQKHCRTGDEHVIADLICDLGHLADELGFDFLSEVRGGASGTGTRSNSTVTTTFSARTRQSKSSSSRGALLDARGRLERGAAPSRLLRSVCGATGSFPELLRKLT